MSEDDQGGISPDDMEPVDEQTAKEIQEDIAESDEDVTRGQRWFAGIQLALFFLGLVATGALSIYFGYVNPDLSVTATVDVGWIIEYIVAAVAAIFVLWLVTNLVIYLPGSVLNALGGVAFGLAKSAGYVEEEE